MKKFPYIASIVVATCLFAGCSEDIGNYSYVDINEVSIEPGDLEEGKTYDLIAFVDNICFDPKIKSTFGINDESAYEYEWRVMPEGAAWTEFDASEVTVCQTRKIDIPVTLSPKKYAAFFCVKDKSTGVTWTTSFFLQVRSITNEGWLVLSDVNDKCDLSIIYNRNETEDLIARDIFSDSEIELGKPQKLIFNYYLKRDQATLLVTDKDTYNLDPTDLHVGEDNRLAWRFGVTPSSVQIKASVMSQYANHDLWAVIDGNDDIYTISRNVDGGFFEYPITKIDGTTPFKPAPFIGVNLNNSSYEDDMYGCMPVVLYDADGQQFLQISNTSVYPSVMEFKGTKYFDNPTGRDMVHMESTRHGVIDAVLRDPSTHETYFYSMKLRGKEIESEYWWEEPEVISYNEQSGYGKVIGPGVEQATMFAFHHLYPYLFYVSGNSVYQFNISEPDQPAKEVLSFPGEEIKVLKFNPFVAWEAYADWERARGYQLVIGTTVPGAPADNCGIMRIYDVPNLMQPLKELKKYDGFGDIVDIVYKERYRS